MIDQPEAKFHELFLNTRQPFSWHRRRFSKKKHHRRLQSLNCLGLLHDLCFPPSEGWINQHRKPSFPFRRTNISQVTWSGKSQHSRLQDRGWPACNSHREPPYPKKRCQRMRRMACQQSWNSLYGKAQLPARQNVPHPSAQRGWKSHCRKLQFHGQRSWPRWQPEYWTQHDYRQRPWPHRAQRVVW